jgi:hypothetical protein
MNNSTNSNLHACAYERPQIPAEWLQTYPHPDNPNPLIEDRAYRTGPTISTLNVLERKWIAATAKGWEGMRKYGHEGLVGRSIIIPPHSRVEFGSGLALRDMSRFTAISVHPPVESNA